MQFEFVVCNDTEILDRQSRQVIGRIRPPRWYGDFWRATIAGGAVEEPTQTQLRVAVQKRLDRVKIAADPIGSWDREDDLDRPEEAARPRRPQPRRPEHVKKPSTPDAVPPPLKKPVNYAMVRRVRVFAQTRAAQVEAAPKSDDIPTRIAK